MKGLTDQKIVQIIRKHVPDVQQVILYGSRAAGTARPDSDHDVRAVVPSSVLDRYEWIDYQVNVDCDLLEANDWNERETPKIDLFVCDWFVEDALPHRILWRAT